MMDQVDVTLGRPELLNMTFFKSWEEQERKRRNSQTAFCKAGQAAAATHHRACWIQEQIWSCFGSIHPHTVAILQRDVFRIRNDCWEWEEIVNALLQIHQLMPLQKRFCLSFVSEKHMCRDRNCLRWWCRSRKKETILVCTNKMQR